MAAKPSLEQAIETLRRDPRQPVRAQVGDLTVELRAVADAVEPSTPIEGLFANEPGLIDEICEEAMQARERDPLRVARTRA
jgi:hypothetical protein